MRTAEEDKAMSPLREAIAALQQRYLNPIESAIESVKSKRRSALDTQIELTTEKHRALEAQITPVIQTLTTERNLKEDALRESNAAFNDEINKRSAETYAAVNEAYHLAKRKLLPQYPLLRGFVDSADRAESYKTLMRLDKCPEVLDDAEAFRLLEEITSQSNERAAKQQNSAGGAAADKASAKE